MLCLCVISPRGLPSFTSSIQSLDAQLVPHTYLVSNYLTAADVAVYGALRTTFVRRTTFEKLQTLTLL